MSASENLLSLILHSLRKRLSPLPPTSCFPLLEGRDWVAEKLKIDDGTSDISVFEVNIRFVGGLLSCYALTGDRVFKDQAVAIAKKLLPAFNTPSGLPFAMVNLKTGKGNAL